MSEKKSRNRLLQMQSKDKKQLVEKKKNVVKVELPISKGVFVEALSGTTGGALIGAAFGVFGGIAGGLIGGAISGYSGYHTRLLAANRGKKSIKSIKVQKNRGRV
ncbi:MAG: hypothetical protein Q8903_14850 [Bacteroidota bacterium]|nr:hypothetical protein [Bacteroidota bacterium]